MTRNRARWRGATQLPPLVVSGGSVVVGGTVVDGVVGTVVVGSVGGVEVVGSLGGTDAEDSVGGTVVESDGAGVVGGAVSEEAVVLATVVAVVAAVDSTGALVSLLGAAVGGVAVVEASALPGGALDGAGSEVELAGTSVPGAAAGVSGVTAA